MKVVLLLSGGLDSTTLLYDLKGQGNDVHCLIFDYKQRHAQELNFAKLHCHKLGVMFTTITLPPLGGLNEQSWVVPNRNMIFLSIAINKAIELGFDTVAIGCNKDDADNFPDCRDLFVYMANKLVKIAGCDVQIIAPYIRKLKWEIGGLAREMGIPFHEIWTCYKGGEKPCGECPACLKLQSAIKI